MTCVNFAGAKGHLPRCRNSFFPHGRNPQSASNPNALPGPKSSAERTAHIRMEILGRAFSPAKPDFVLYCPYIFVFKG